MLKLILQADRKSAQALRQRLPPLIDALETLVQDGGMDQSGRPHDPAEARPGQGVTIGIVLSEAANVSPDRLQRLRDRFPGGLAIDSVFALPSRFTDLTGFETWCAARVRTMLDFLLAEYAAGQLAAAGLRRRTEELERSLAAAEETFAEFRREPLKLAYRAERAGTYALPLMASDDDGPQSLEIHQTLRRTIANIRYIDVFFNGDSRDLEGTARFTARAAWSGKLLCDSTVALQEIGRGWTQFRCDPLDSSDAEPLSIELHMAGPDLGWLTPAFSHMSPLPEECAVIVDHMPIGRPLALQIWSGIAGIEAPSYVGASGAPDGSASRTGLPNVLSIAPDQLGKAELISRLPPDLTFAPVSYDTGTQSLLVHPLGLVPTVARLPPLSVSHLNALSAIVQLKDPAAQLTEFALAALPSSGRALGSDVRPSAGEDLDLSAVAWHAFNAREWGEIEVCFPRRLEGEIQIYLLTRNQSDEYGYSSAYFRGLKLTCSPANGAERPPA